VSTLVLEAISPLARSSETRGLAGRAPAGPGSAHPVSQGDLAQQLPGSNLQSSGRKGLYLRANPVAASSAGGMATHVSRFGGGAFALGHDFDLISSSVRPEADPASRVDVVPLSTSLSATRALFELWNSIRFTFAAVRIYRQHRAHRHWQFIYQRYNRFNCAGVLLSCLSGLPLVLEYNGSEIWVARNWDPVGMMPLLKRFERI